MVSKKEIEKQIIRLGKAFLKAKSVRKKTTLRNQIKSLKKVLNDITTEPTQTKLVIKKKVLQKRIDTLNANLLKENNEDDKTIIKNSINVLIKAFNKTDALLKKKKQMQKIKAKMNKLMDVNLSKELLNKMTVIKLKKFISVNNLFKGFSKMRKEILVSEIMKTAYFKSRQNNQLPVPKKKMTKPKKPYCGIGNVPFDKQLGTGKQCLKSNQVRYYGIEAIDKSILENKNLLNPDKEFIILKQIEASLKGMAKALTREKGLKKIDDGKIDKLTKKIKKTIVEYRAQKKQLDKSKEFVSK